MNASLKTLLISSVAIITLPALASDVPEADEIDYSTRKLDLTCGYVGDVMGKISPEGQYLSFINGDWEPNDNHDEAHMDHIRANWALRLINDGGREAQIIMRDGSIHEISRASWSKNHVGYGDYKPFDEDFDIAVMDYNFETHQLSHMRLNAMSSLGYESTVIEYTSCYNTAEVFPG